MKEHIIIRDLLSLAAADALDPAEQRQVAEHLRLCEVCRAELDTWTRIAGVLRELPAPSVPPKLALQTRRRLEAHAAAGRSLHGSRFLPVFLVLFSWIVTVLTWRLMGLLDIPLIRWLDVSSTIGWVAYMGATWLVAALAAGLLGRHSQQEGKTI